MLLVLLVPLLATLLSAWGRWRVAGEDVTVGYDPVAIARLGPVVGGELAPGIVPAEKSARREEDMLRVWRWRRNYVGGDGRTYTTSGLQAFGKGTWQQEHYPQDKEYSYV